MARPSEKEQDQEVVELLEEVFRRIGVSTDQQASEKLGISPSQFSHWRAGRMPGSVRSLLKAIL